MKKLTPQTEAALVKRLNATLPSYKDGVTGEIDVDGLLEAALDDLARNDAEAHADLLGAAPLIVARAVYQDAMRRLRWEAKKETGWLKRTGEPRPTEQRTAREHALVEAAPALLDSWFERLTPAVLSMQFSYQGPKGRWHRREYGDLTAPDMRTLQDKYEREARSKQETADMFRTDCDIFERLQRQHFGDITPGMTIRDFLGNKSVVGAA